LRVLQLRGQEAGDFTAAKANFVKRRAAFANPLPMQFTNREMTGGWKRHLSAAIALGLFMAFLGGFGTQQALSPTGRLLFWVSLVVTGYLLALAAGRLIGPRPQNVIVRTIAIALLSGLPQTFIVSWALVQVRPGRVITVGNLPMLFLTVVIVQTVIVAVQSWILLRETGSADSTPPGKDRAQQPPGRIPRVLRGELVALESEDHYVRIHHRSGSTLILHRFSDAIAELDSREGLQVHRSWWVASGAVAGSFIRSGKRWLKLSNGMEIPVSRTHLRRVVEQNWPRVVAPVSDEA